MMSKYDVHPTLLRDLLGTSGNEDDYLALMILFHTHIIKLSRDVVLCDVETRNADSSISIFPVTRSLASEILEQCVLPKKSAEYWHAQYNECTPYEVMDDVPEPLRSKVMSMRELVLTHPIVLAVSED